ncbi:ComEA family DNA-binding protein [Rahnella aquatilis]|uniref:Competence protein ComEA-like protein with helix-hairpin-helix repeat region n=1 Tax=Rahnella aquatilis (strain ATCC 33071 / DSM 4594 / JCM 1683 / NBRC 105701 / NCIMB 13365 / CIP 78.65) TaxID=745277 RepID=H2IZI2_RAHAC|nr:helix-hairpin-helix domain-containing protein [Rahnella aquatilis]AEX53225.1 competence protein ComEA-like protein with helix-hairpin-helix repeat region [Rahnella aquatilis CIP 78.65 = ATCC 33071]KFD04104.1 DNA uptake protein [Rahnella aquatilis CIP 78.65 = ATCC 33071]
MKKLGITSLSLALALGLSTLPVMLQAAPNATSSVATTTAAPAAAPSKVTGPQVKKEQVAVAGESTVSINTATAEEFASVMNGVGMKKAQAIISYREELGQFTDIEQLREVPGIGAALFERNKDRLKL